MELVLSLHGMHQSSADRAARNPTTVTRRYEGRWAPLAPDREVVAPLAVVVPHAVPTVHDRRRQRGTNHILLRWRRGATRLRFRLGLGEAFARACECQRTRKAEYQHRRGDLRHRRQAPLFTRWLGE